MVAIAAQHGAKMYKMDTTQAFLYGDVEEDLFVRATDWWPELVPEGHCLQLKKIVRDTAGFPSMASPYLWMDEVTRISGYQQRKDYVYEMGRR